MNICANDTTLMVQIKKFNLSLPENITFDWVSTKLRCKHWYTNVELKTGIKRNSKRGLGCRVMFPGIPRFLWFCGLV